METFIKEKHLTLIVNVNEKLIKCFGFRITETKISTKKKENKKQKIKS